MECVQCGSKYTIECDVYEAQKTFCSIESQAQTSYNLYKLAKDVKASKTIIKNYKVDFDKWCSMANSIGVHLGYDTLDEKYFSNAEEEALKERLEDLCNE